MALTTTNNNGLFFNLHKTLLFFLIAFVFHNCKNKEEKSDDIVIDKTEIEEVVIEPSLEKGCYRYNQNGNMVNLEITKNDNPVLANLTYQYAEKDKNIGTFEGEFNDGILLGMYTFQSEGVESKRQVAFKLKDDQLIEGYGEVNEDGTMFKDVNSLNYSSTMPLKKSDCSE